MKTLISTEVRIYFINNKYYADSGFAKIIERYNNKFKNIVLLTRIISQKDQKKGYVEITGYCNEFISIDSIPKFMIKNNKKELIKLINSCDLIILRVPSVISSKLFNIIKEINKTYMVEVMGCIWDAYWNHGIVGKIIAPYFFIRMKKIVYNANYATYVTERFLQKRYPCKNKSIGVSNVNIENIVNNKDYKKFNKNDFSIMTSGALNVKYKGQHLVIKALKRLKKEGINIKYYLAGKGDNNYLKKVAKRENIEDNIIFLGVMSHDKLLDKMNDIDIYIQPSLQEGLPRSLIEAMSQGCVCLGSTTAGIPELLNSKQVFKRNSISAITESIKSIRNSDLEKISNKNIEKSKEFRKDILDKRRYSYYDEIIRDMNNIRY